jgi:hypothetical protein
VDLTSGLIEGKRWKLNIIICSWNMVALVMSVWWSCFPQSNTLLFIECSDVAGREHIVHVNLPPDYPEKQPLATAVSPSMCYFPSGWSPIQMFGALCGSFFSLESDATLTHLYLSTGSSHCCGVTMGTRWNYECHSLTIPTCRVHLFLSQICFTFNCGICLERLKF